jgi:hypothetical protein
MFPRTACLLIALALVFSGCGDDAVDRTTSTATATTVASQDPGFFTALDATWGAAALDGLSYGITVTFNGDTEIGAEVAEVGYPGLDCAGVWTLTSVDGGTITADEEIQFNPDDACTDGGSVRLTRNGSTMSYQWYYPSGAASDTGTLIPG